MWALIRRGLYLAAPLALLAAPPAAASTLTGMRQSIFKIQIVANEPDFSSPWNRERQNSASGTGFYIGEAGILTNAHVVANAAFITVLRDGDASPVPAYVRHIAHDSDLALLTVADFGVFKGLAPMRLGRLPRLQSPVATIGFPTGGEQLSVTQGVVSRISFRRYVHHGGADHLLVQVDSAINPGNSGGPVVQGAAVVGVAFQAFAQAENTGYIIPTPVIGRFLKDIENGAYDGHPESGLEVMEAAMLNPSTAAYHGLKDREGGVKVAAVAAWAPAAGRIEPGDILSAIDGQPIGVDGRIVFQGERVDFRTVYDLKQLGDRVRFTLVRAGRPLDVTLDLVAARPHYRSGYLYTSRPQYFVWGGLVFTALSRSWLKTFGERWYREAPLAVRYLDLYSTVDPDFRDTEAIPVLARRLPDEVNAYATANLNGVLTHVGERKVRSIAELIAAVEEGQDPFVVLRFYGSDEPLVLARAAVALRNDAINLKYGVRPDRWLATDDGAVRQEAAP